MADGIDPSKAEAYLRRLTHARLEAAAIFLVGEIKQMISIPSRTVKYQQGKGGSFKKVLGSRGSDRSRPGEPPHKDYGTLRQSITWDIRDDGASVVARIGSPLAYARFLEIGTARMAARPFLRRALKENAEAIRQIAERGERSSITVAD